MKPAWSCKTIIFALVTLDELPEDFDFVLQVGLISDEKLIDLLDLALSADTVNTVKNLRMIMETGVDPLALMSQLATVITDILAGSYDYRKERRRRKFFRNQPCESKSLLEKSNSPFFSIIISVIFIFGSNYILIIESFMFSLVFTIEIFSMLELLLVACNALMETSLSRH